MESKYFNWKHKRLIPKCREDYRLQQSCTHCEKINSMVEIESFYFKELKGISKLISTKNKAIYQVTRKCCRCGNETIKFEQKTIENKSTIKRQSSQIEEQKKIKEYLLKKYSKDCGEKGFSKSTVLYFLILFGISILILFGVGLIKEDDSFWIGTLFFFVFIFLVTRIETTCSCGAKGSFELTYTQYTGRVKNEHRKSTYDSNGNPSGEEIVYTYKDRYLMIYECCKCGNERSTEGYE